MKPPFSSIRVANWFIDKSLESGVELTPMKLQKLVYIAHGWHLGLFESPLVDEDIQAWKYGPVIPSIYHEAKKYGSRQISQRLLEVSALGINRPTLTNANDDDALSISLLQIIWDRYGHLDGIALSNLTHKADTPWSKTWGNMQKEGLHRSRISNSDIQKHYAGKVASLGNETVN